MKNLFKKILVIVLIGLFISTSLITLPTYASSSPLQITVWARGTYSDHIDLSWTSIKKAKSYSIWISKSYGDNFTELGSTSKAYATITDLDPGTQYRIKIRVEYSNGTTSLFSTSNSFRTSNY